MITILNTSYKLCLIDTCVISEILKNKLTIGKQISSKFIDERYIFCYAIQTIGELKRAKDLFYDFFEYLFPLLSFMMKNYNQLLEDEIRCYPSINNEKPFLFFFDPLRADFNKKIKEHFESDKMNEFFKNEIKDTPDTLESIKQAILEWPPKGKQYTRKEIEDWAQLVVWKKIIEINKDFVFHQKNKLNHIIDYKKFQSWLIISYVMFYRFYMNRDRIPKPNDLNDILITCSLPYVDAIIAEKDLCEILRQIQSKHNFVKHLEIMNLKDFR
jgi:hypothetical protein